MASVKPKAEIRGGEAEGPDGGSSWVLVVALFVSTSLVFGLMRSLGIFFVEFVQYFDESAQAISWISSIGLASQQFFSESPDVFEYECRVCCNSCSSQLLPAVTACGGESVCIILCICSAGPLGAALCNAYDTRLVVMAGGCLSGLGLILASQATCLVHLYLTMGVISGNNYK